MAGEWRSVSLSDLAELKSDVVNPAEHPDELFQHFSIPAFDESRGPLLQRGSEIGSHKFSVPNGAILISKLNPRFPRVWEVQLNNTHPAIASTEFLVLVGKDSIDRRFLKYLCLSPDFLAQMQAMATGTSGSHQRVSPRDLLRLEVRIPPLPE